MRIFVANFDGYQHPLESELSSSTFPSIAPHVPLLPRERDHRFIKMLPSVSGRIAFRFLAITGPNFLPEFVPMRADQRSV